MNIWINLVLILMSLFSGDTFIFLNSVLERMWLVHVISFSAGPVEVLHGLWM